MRCSRYQGDIPKLQRPSVQRVFPELRARRCTGRRHLWQGLQMALRVARGLFRLWLVLSALWIGGVGVVTWREYPAPLARGVLA